MILLKDVTEWEHIGHGGKSTLEKEELRSPEGNLYLIKYPRLFQVGVSWEDITELIAAKIGTLMGLDMMKVEMVIRNGRRGCLLRNFVEEYEAIMAEEGGALLPEQEIGYNELQSSDLRNEELIDAAFKMIEKFTYWNKMKAHFIEMQLFDILIGNQDRHPFNWQLLFLDSSDINFSPIYDNGASLGFRFEDEQLQVKSSSTVELNRYFNKTSVKAGLFEKKKVKAKDLLFYLKNNYPDELNAITEKLLNFDSEMYNRYIQSLHILNNDQKNWLLKVVPFRRDKILENIRREEEK